MGAPYAEGMAEREGVHFLKGHGTQNDFVILPDADAQLDLTAAKVAAICDRRAGIGADGVLRVVPVHAVDGISAARAQWFMDYHNADGSIAEMCGNGARVFARFLADEGWEANSQFVIATRAGEHEVSVGPRGQVSVEMGKAIDGPLGDSPKVLVAGEPRDADAWWVPNPHAVVFVDDVVALESPLLAPEVIAYGRFPDGQNVEYACDRTIGDELHAEVRVHERGVGETKSCGTGVYAVSLSLRKRHNVAGPSTSTVDVPGGRLWVEHAADGRVRLIGPTELVARGTFLAKWWENAG